MGDGSKSIDRVGHILRVLENGTAEELTIGEIAKATHLDRTTVRRAVVSMERIGLLDRDPRSRSYRLGTYLFSLGAKTARRFDVLTHARDVVATLAEETGDTVFLTIRNKYDMVCIDRRSGSYPIKAQTLSIGESLPLGLSSAGLAILATMSDEDVRHVVQYNTAKFMDFHRVSPGDLFHHVRETRTRGYALYYGHIVAGMGALAFAIKDAQGEASAAISISAVLDRLTDERVRCLAELCREKVVEIEQRAALISHTEIGRR